MIDWETSESNNRWTKKEYFHLLIPNILNIDTFDSLSVGTGSQSQHFPSIVNQVFLKNT